MFKKDCKSYVTVILLNLSTLLTTTASLDRTRRRRQEYVPNDKGFAPVSSIHSSTDLNNMWNNSNSCF